MGDVLWYLSQIAEWADIPFEEVAKANIEELNQRYPTGFKSKIKNREWKIAFSTKQLAKLGR